MSDQGYGLGLACCSVSRWCDLASGLVQLRPLLHQASLKRGGDGDDGEILLFKPNGDTCGDGRPGGGPSSLQLERRSCCDKCCG